jgi:hypothetical protein
MTSPLSELSHVALPRRTTVPRDSVFAGALSAHHLTEFVVAGGYYADATDTPPDA